MTVVYLDSVFLFNALIDYLLVLAAARLAGIPLHRGRYAFCGLLGGLYAAAVFLPGCGFLAAVPVKMAAGVLLALVIAVPFALLRAKLGIGDNPVGLNANVTLFACGLMLFAVFNAVFLLSFYRTAYKVGVSFVKACIVMAVAAFIMEAAVHFPALSRFNGYDLACQLPLLAAGLVIWCGSWPLIFRGAAARYEKVDL